MTRPMVMDAGWRPVEDERTRRAMEYIEKTQRRVARAQERRQRKWQRFADRLFDAALSGALVFFALAVLVSL